MLHEEGLDRVFARHDRHAEGVRRAVKAWGLEILCKDPKYYSSGADGRRDARGAQCGQPAQDRARSLRCVAGHGARQGGRQGVPHRPSGRHQRPDGHRRTGRRGDGAVARQRAAQAGRRGRGHGLFHRRRRKRATPKRHRTGACRDDERRTERRSAVRGEGRGRPRHLQQAGRAQCPHVRDVRPAGRDLRHAAAGSIGAGDHRHRRRRKGVRSGHRHLAVPQFQHRRGRSQLRRPHGADVRQVRALPRADHRRHTRHLHRRRGGDCRGVRSAGSPRAT